MTSLFKNNWNLPKDIFTRSIYKSNHLYNERPSLLKMHSFLLNKQGRKLSNKKGIIYEHENILLEKYMKLHKPKDNCFKVKYFLPIHKWGRINAVDGLTISIFHRPTRHALCAAEYIDLDLVNAQPFTLNEICKQNNYYVPQLNAYCTDREDQLKTIMCCHGVTRETAKKLPLQLVFGGTYDSWIYEFCTLEGGLFDHKRVEWVLKFEEEQEKLRDIVYENNLQIVKDVEKAEPNKFTLKEFKTPDGILAKKKRTCMALWSQTIERHIQEMVINHLVVNRKFSLKDIVPC